jgi:hypothetical protein
MVDKLFLATTVSLLITVTIMICWIWYVLVRSQEITDLEEVRDSNILIGGFMAAFLLLSLTLAVSKWIWDKTTRDAAPPPAPRPQPAPTVVQFSVPQTT